MKDKQVIPGDIGHKSPYPIDMSVKREVNRAARVPLPGEHDAPPSGPNPMKRTDFSLFNNAESEVDQFRGKLRRGEISNLYVVENYHKAATSEPLSSSNSSNSEAASENDNSSSSSSSTSSSSSSKESSTEFPRENGSHWLLYGAIAVVILGAVYSIHGMISEGDSNQDIYNEEDDKLCHGKSFHVKFSDAVMESTLFMQDKQESKDLSICAEVPKKQDQVQQKSQPLWLQRPRKW